MGSPGTGPGSSGRTGFGFGFGWTWPSDFGFGSGNGYLQAEKMGSGFGNGFGLPKMVPMPRSKWNTQFFGMIPQIGSFFNRTSKAKFNNQVFELNKRF